MDLYDIAVARKLSSGGGGGSSDFSTAEVTIVGNFPAQGFEKCPMCWEEVGILFPVAMDISHTGKIIVPLYKGKCAWVNSAFASATITGNATYGNGTLTITGDCTITIS